MIPFNKPFTTGKETLYINDAILRGKLSGNGFYTNACHHFFERFFGFNKVLLTNSCTDALEMCALLLDIKSGDEVIMPSFTFVSTANAFALRGAKIVFADTCFDTPNLDVSKIESLITKNTKAIVVTHYGGIATEMNAVLELAVSHGLIIVEDAAQCIGGKYNNLNLGSIGHLATFSFHETKNIHAGEGGMLVINDARFIERAEVIWEKGTNRSAFFKGQVDSYNWIDLGSSFLPSEITAAFLLAQTEAYEQISAMRKSVWEVYYEQLSPIAGADTFHLPALPHYTNHNYHVFALVCKNFIERSNLIKKLSSAGFMAVSHYKALHSSPFFQAKHDGRELLNSQRFEDCLIRLPLYPELAMEHVYEICSTVKAFYMR
jgi:dTDP-4-amino-4,6-dideoxygalactose transaminase